MRQFQPETSTGVVESRTGNLRQMAETGFLFLFWATILASYVLAIYAAILPQN